MTYHWLELADANESAFYGGETMTRQHPSNTVHEATNYFDALNRHEDAVRYEKAHLSRYDGDLAMTPEEAGPFDNALRESDAARKIWADEYRDLCAAIDRLTREAKQRAAAEMRHAGLDDIYADACESDDFGLLAI